MDGYTADAGFQIGDLYRMNPKSMAADMILKRSKAHIGSADYQIRKTVPVEDQEKTQEQAHGGEVEIKDTT